MIEAEIVWRHIHALHQFFGLIYYGCSVTPGKNGCEETRNLDILLLFEKMGNANWIILDEGGAVILLNLSIQEFF